MSQTSIALSNLRAVVILIVLAFHSCLAYLASAPAPTAPFDRAPYTWMAFPVVDSHKWLGLDVFCAWQDISLMSLMFLLSGLFVASSLRRKGSWTYISDRLWRIGVPFAVAVLILSPLAIFPAYTIRTPNPSLSGFWQQWTSLPLWPNGPEWFLWQLLAVNLLAAGLYAVAPRSFDPLVRLSAWAGDRPRAFFTGLAALSVCAYVPLALAYSPWDWSSLGPFAFQISRPPLYVLFFFTGLVLGSRGLDRGLLSCDGPLARHWLAWFGTALLSFAVWAGFTSLTQPDWAAAPLLYRVVASIAYAVACPAGGLFLLAVCLRFARMRRAALDSLSANAYGMYLVHYVFIVWLQYLLLPAGLPAIAKAAIVFAGTLALSWASCVAYARLARGSYPFTAGRAVSPLLR